MTIAVHRLRHVPLAMRFLQLIGTVAIADNVSPRTFVEAIDLRRFSVRTSYAHTVLAGESRAVGHPEVTRASLVDLELDRPRPDLVGTLDVVENAAVSRQASLRRKGGLAPLEFSSQVTILVLMFGDEVSYLFAGDLDDPFFHREDMTWIGVEPGARQVHVELVKIPAVKQNHRRPVLGNAFGLRPAEGGGCQQSEQQCTCYPANSSLRHECLRPLTL